MLLWLLSSGLRCCSCLAAFQGVHTFTVENACGLLLRHVYIRLNGVTSKKIRQNLRSHTIIYFSLCFPNTKSQAIRTYIHTEIFLAVLHICESGFLLGRNDVVDR